jgi:hypothetical protein
MLLGQSFEEPTKTTKLVKLRSSSENLGFASQVSIESPESSQENYSLQKDNEKLALSHLFKYALLNSKMD